MYFKFQKKNTQWTKYLNLPLKNTVIPQYLWGVNSTQYALWILQYMAIQVPGVKWCSMYI